MNEDDDDENNGIIYKDILYITGSNDCFMVFFRGVGGEENDVPDVLAITMTQKTQYP